MVRFLTQPLTLGSATSPDRRKRTTDGWISAVLLNLIMLSAGISLTICQIFKLHREVYPSIGIVLPSIAIVLVFLSMLVLIVLVLKRPYWTYSKEELERGMRRARTEVYYRDPARVKLLPLSSALIGLGCISFHLIGAYHHFRYHFYFYFSAEITFKIFYCLQIPFTILLVIFIYVYSRAILKNRLSLRYIFILLVCSLIFSYLTVFVDKYSAFSYQDPKSFPNNLELFLVLFAMQFLVLVSSFIYECWVTMEDVTLQIYTNTIEPIEPNQPRVRSSKAKRKTLRESERKPLLGSAEDSSDNGGAVTQDSVKEFLPKDEESVPSKEDEETAHISGRCTPNATRVKAIVERLEQSKPGKSSPTSSGTPGSASPSRAYTVLEARKTPEYSEYFYPKPRLTPCDDSIYEVLEEEEHMPSSMDEDSNVYDDVCIPQTKSKSKQSPERYDRKSANKEQRRSYGALQGNNEVGSEIIYEHSQIKPFCFHALKIVGIIIGFVFSLSMLLFAIILTVQCQTNTVHNVTCLGRHYNTSCDILAVRTFIYAYYGCKTVLFIFLIICCWVFFHIFGKDSNGYHVSNLHPQDKFLLFSAFGVFLHQSFCAFSAISNIGVGTGNDCFMRGLPILVLVEAMLSIIVTYLQTTLLVSNFTSEKYERRQTLILITILTAMLMFVVISNTAMWLLHGFFTVSPYFCLPTMQKLFYGDLGWFVISFLTLPFVLFYHLQSILSSFSLMFLYRRNAYQER